MLPRFFVSEDWDPTTGNVDIYFDDRISQELMTHVKEELQKMLPKVPKDERTPYHLERMVGGIFSNAAVNGKLKKDSIHNHWTLSGLMTCQR